MRVCVIAFFNIGDYFLRLLLIIVGDFISLLVEILNLSIKLPSLIYSSSYSLIFIILLSSVIMFSLFKILTTYLNRLHSSRELDKSRVAIKDLVIMIVFILFTYFHKRLFTMSYFISKSNQESNLVLSRIPVAPLSQLNYLELGYGIFSAFVLLIAVCLSILIAIQILIRIACFSCYVAGSPLVVIDLLKYDRLNAYDWLRAVLSCIVAQFLQILIAIIIIKSISLKHISTDFHLVIYSILIGLGLYFSILVPKAIYSIISGNRSGSELVVAYRVFKQLGGC